MNKSIKVRAVLPHFYREMKQSSYGSSRAGQRQARSIALSRCISSLISQMRHIEACVLNIGAKVIDIHRSPKLETEQLSSIEIEVHVFTDGINMLTEILEYYSKYITVHSLNVKNPRTLPLHARNWLVNAMPEVDLSFYLEDDLVVNDPLFFDKQYWFLNRSNDNAVLMPHRYELNKDGSSRLLVDGPLSKNFIHNFCSPIPSAAAGRFNNGEEIVFDKTDNPHSGCFVINSDQVKRLRHVKLPNEGFVGPLETAATLTVLQHFQIFKPSISQHRFLQIEHGHPSFVEYLLTLPKNQLT